jgi:hypothetical protein
MVTAASYVDWGSMWKILVISLICGVGLVAVFAVCLLALSRSGYIRDAEAQQTDAVVRRNAPALAVAVACAVIVIIAAIYGLHEIFVKG